MEIPISRFMQSNETNEKNEKSRVVKICNRCFQIGVLIIILFYFLIKQEWMQQEIVNLSFFKNNKTGTD